MEEAKVNPRLKILVADDHHLVREGLKLALREIDPAIVIVEADTLGKAIDAYRNNTDFDLVLLDLTMPGNTGMSVLEGFENSCPDARVVVISASYDLQTVQAAVRRGVLGFIPKLAGKDALISAVRFILAGGIYIPLEAMMAMPEEDRLAHAMPRAMNTTVVSRTPRDAGLTTRQIEVLRQLLEGKSNKQICRDMNLAMGTVKGHVAAILVALKVSSRAEAIAAAMKLGWGPLLADAQVATRDA
ncbi:response regulator transcription factor [Hydrogenophaga sp.]|uniref:response regulator n=1 Tax=Hydrogenophaga sp. TaxID=1904254 RepID=UPI002727C6AE|nr:response regulator transcription factor [Hydrogenophaga sp.]MDO9438788.1 response regulator transcription factor [Hydrogenophaga sp.]